MAQGLSSLGTAAIGEEIILSPEEEAQLTEAPALVEQSPLESLSAQELFDFSVQTKGDFSPIQEFRQRKDLWGNQELRQKVADANDLIEKRGFDPSDLSIKNAAKGVWDVVKGVGKYAYSQAASNVGAPLAAFLSDVAGGPDVGAELADLSQRQVAESIAATETAVTGLSQMAERGAQKTARGLGLAQPLEDRTPEDKVKALWDAVGKADVLDAAVSGKGAFLGSPLVGKYVVEELEKRGVPVRPEEVSELAAGDPVSFWAFGKAFQGLGKIPIPSPVAAGAATVGAKAGEVLTKAAGKTVTGAGNAAEVVGKTAQKPGVVVGTAMTIGALKGGPLGALAAAGGAQALKGATKIAGRAIAKSGEKLADLGRQVSGATPVRSNLALAARDLGAALPGAAGAVAEGAALDLGIAALTSERPEETAHAAALGTVFGLGKGAVKVGGRVLSGQIVAPRAWGQAEPFAQVSNFPGLADMSTAATAKAAPGVVERVNAIRQALSKTNTEFYLADSAAAMEKALTDLGIAPDKAKTVSEQAGFFTGALSDANGKPRRVVLTRDIDAAPHESFHAIQDVMGEAANRKIDELVKQEYANRWETEGRKYAARLLGITPEQLAKQGGKGGVGVNWREAVADASGWIRAEVAEQMWQDVNAKFQSQETNLTPPPEVMRTEVARLWKEWQDAGGNWRDVIPAERQETLLTEVSDRYIARELAAENYDAAFKNLGVSLKNKGFLGKLANIAASAVTAFGGEPLAGRTSEFGQVPLRGRVVQAALEQARGIEVTPVVEPSVTPLKPVVTPTPVAPPTPTPTPTQRVAEWLDTNAKALPVAERAPAARTLNQAVESGQGVRVSYWGAKGEPGGDPSALRPERRAQIEAQRDAVNKDRQLVMKDFFPYSVTLTSKGPQFIGWSPNNFNANVTRLTEWIGANPTAAKNIKLPYFLGNEAGQRALQADLQVFVQNQRAGFTGSGKELVVPKDVAAAGFTAPEKTGVQPVSLPQERADLINYLFNMRLPDTPRIARGKLPLSVAGQKISVATEAGRVSEPVQPRVPFKGEKAKALGIEGESIQEVNPLRRSVEKAAKDAGVKPPELIEAAQRLNVERLADATVAPELAPFEGNVLTLTAGFQPQRGTAWEVRGTTRTGEKQTIRVQAADMAGARSEAENQGMSRIENVRSAADPVEISTGMFSPQKVNWEVRGTAKGEKKIIMVSAEDIAGARAEAEKQGLSRVDTVRDASTPMALDTGAFQPLPSTDTIRKSDPAGWKEITDNYKGGKFGGGLTGLAMEMGASAKSPEQLKEWVDAGAFHKEAAKSAISVGDFNEAMSQASKGQFYREALETATGEGGSVAFIQKHLDPEYKPPFPKVTVEKK